MGFIPYKIEGRSPFVPAVAESGSLDAIMKLSATCRRHLAQHQHDDVHPDHGKFQIVNIDRDGCFYILAKILFEASIDSQKWVFSTDDGLHTLLHHFAYPPDGCVTVKEVAFSLITSQKQVKLLGMIPYSNFLSAAQFGPEEHMGESRSSPVTTSHLTTSPKQRIQPGPGPEEASNGLDLLLAATAHQSGIETRQSLIPRKRKLMLQDHAQTSRSPRAAVRHREPSSSYLATMDWTRSIEVPKRQDGNTFPLAGWSAYVMADGTSRDDAISVSDSGSPPRPGCGGDL